MVQIPGVRGPNEPEYSRPRGDNITTKTELPSTLAKSVEVSVAKALHALGWFVSKGTKIYVEELVKALSRCHVYF
ncbi:MAG: hypothetical protein JSR37_03445 [Verrucomicrobia bacterium]|nr:hypothetical protein [Verrucomicrobiota bacterium]MBS0637740.1 hypothetical protein [Verrucomicrobiota bacterium]